MNPILFATLLTLFAGLATVVGGIIVFFVKDFNKKFLAMTLAFAVGIMLYISFVELFSEAREFFEYYHGEENALIFATVAFFAGVVLIALIQRVLPRRDVDVLTDNKNELKQSGVMTAVAMAIHNFPEGMIVFVAAMHDPSLGILLAFAIAIHNIPEGIAVAMPIYYATGSRRKALFASAAAGVTEPIGGILGFLLLSQIFTDDVFGVSFAFVAGIMVFISLHLLLPLAHKYGDAKRTMQAVVVGMAVMAVSLFFI